MFLNNVYSMDFLTGNIQVDAFMLLLIVFPFYLLFKWVNDRY